MGAAPTARLGPAAGARALRRGLVLRCSRTSLGLGSVTAPSPRRAPEHGLDLRRSRATEGRAAVLGNSGCNGRDERLLRQGQLLAARAARCRVGRRSFEDALPPRESVDDLCQRGVVLRRGRTARGARASRRRRRRGVEAAPEVDERADRSTPRGGSRPRPPSRPRRSRVVRPAPSRRGLFQGKRGRGSRLTGWPEVSGTSRRGAREGDRGGGGDGTRDPSAGADARAHRARVRVFGVSRRTIGPPIAAIRTWDASAEPVYCAMGRTVRSRPPAFAAMTATTEPSAVLGVQRERLRGEKRWGVSEQLARVAKRARRRDGGAPGAR